MANNPEQPVDVIPTPSCKQQRLIDVLSACEKAGVKNLLLANRAQIHLCHNSRNSERVAIADLRPSMLNSYGEDDFDFAGRKWWGGISNAGGKMPYRDTIWVDMRGNNYANQAAPLLVSSAGRYIWSDEAFAF